jgi:signal transduction histidine kinase
VQGRFKRDSGAAGDPEQQPGGTGTGPAQAAGDSGSATSGTAAATGRTTTPSGIEAGRITGLDGKPGSRIAMRNWRISTRLVSLLALPVVTAGALGALRIQQSQQNIEDLKRLSTLTDIAEHATDLADAVAEERDVAAGPVTAKTTSDEVTATRAQTDKMRDAYQKASDALSTQGDEFVGVRSTLIAIDTQLTALNNLRSQAFTSETTIAQTVTDYDNLVQSLLSLSVDMAQATQNSDMISATRGLAAFSSAREYESMQRAVISAALARDPKHHRLSLDEYGLIKRAGQQENINLTRFAQLYKNSADLEAPIQPGSATIQAHDQMLTRINSAQDGIETATAGTSYMDWDDAAKAKIDAMNRIERSLLNEMQKKSRELQDNANRDALISGAIILLVLGIAVVGAFVVARSMIRSLRRLQQTAQDVAQKRLPELVRQLSDADPQDVDTSVESIGINSRDEIGQVARAFDEVHSEAVRLAAEQALLRGNVNAMFTNLSRRSQGLIQRQLSLISELESREADPDQLSSLFKLDHLATRMRRNGENLLVLAGEEPGRRWTRPVPLVDVLRAAASEVEQYERIELTSVPSAEVTGRIVNDLVHLLAELLENATSFSSPQTKVRVTGHALPDGRVLIEIHDTGIGLSPEDLADINDRLASPPTVDVSVSRRMGLFVVGRLSLRHGIRIQLRPSDSGGTTALVMLPVDVTQGGAKPGPAGAGGGQQQRAATGGGSGIANAFGNAPGSAQVGRNAQRGEVGGAQRPALAAGGGRPGAPQQPSAPRWAAQDGQQGFPGDPGDDRGRQDAPRGHEDVEAAPASYENTANTAGPAGAARGDFRQGGDDRFGTGQFPGAQQQGTGATGFRSDVFGGRPGPRQGDSEHDAFGGGAPGQGGPGDTAQFPQVPARDDFPREDERFGGDDPFGTGQFPAPPQQGQDGPQFPRTSRERAEATGQFRLPDTGRSPAETGQFPTPPQHQGQGGPGDTAQFPQIRAEDPFSGAPGQGTDQGTGQFPAPPAPPAGRQGGPGRQAPGREQEQQASSGGPAGQQPPAPQQGAPGLFDQRPAQRQPQPAPVPEPMALPPAPTRGDEPTPIFSAIESDWFRTGQAERMQQIHVEPGARGQQAPSPRPVGRTAPPQRPRTDRPGPQRPGGATPAAPAAGQQPAPAPAAGPQQAAASPAAQPLPRETPNWRTSPNDALRQRAEAVREPSAGGVTPSGLPRRVPRANLVPGGAAQQQAQQGGPQVSRAPDDVRGRLTNLRRGIQQGRQAGGTTDGGGFGTNHQER